MPALIETKILAIIVLVLLLAAMAMYLRMERLKIATLSAQLQEVEQTNHDDQDAIKQMSGALGQWQSQANAALQARNSAQLAMAQMAADRQKSQQQTTKLENADHGIAKCADALAVDLDAVCPGTVGAMRLRRAAGDLQGPIGLGAHPATGPVRR